MTSPRHLLLLGRGSWAAGLAEALVEHGFAVTASAVTLPPRSRYDLVVVEISSSQQFQDPGGRFAVPWIACCGVDDPHLATACYAAGAFAVLPIDAPVDIVLATVERNLALAGRRPAQAPRIELYAAGEHVSLRDSEVLTVLEGVAAHYALHDDGAEVLLGLWGAGEVLPGHPDDSCCLEVRAHTRVKVRLQPWHEALAEPELAEAMRRRLRRMEAWSSMQARPNMEQRLAGILSLLAEQFGHRHGKGLLIDVRVTHSQLAAAIGANRATVTRLLGQLRQRGDVSTIGGQQGERLLWRRPHVDHHGHVGRLVG